MNQDILHRYLSGDASEEEKAEIVRWVDENPEHLEELKALGIIYDAKIWYEDHNLHVESTQEPTSHFRHYLIGFSKIAAIFIIGFFVSFFALHYLNKEPVRMLSFYAPVGQRAEISLDDGTQVWLNANSKIIYPSVFNQKERKVVLKGEAYFKVTHNAKRPFIVDAQGYSVRVLGTEFNVLAYSPKNYEVDLLKGSVHVTTPNKQMAKLTPGERIYMEDGEVVKGNIEHYEHFQWTDGLISFNEEPLDEIFEKIELYYNVHITILNKGVLRNHYSGKFRVRDGVEHIIRVMQIVNKFKYSITDDRTNIIIK